MEKEDPRPSIEARYAGKADYVRRVKTVASALRLRRFLLEEDVRKIVEAAENMAWPPKPTNEPPFWEVERQ